MRSFCGFSTVLSSLLIGLALVAAPAFAGEGHGKDCAKCECKHGKGSKKCKLKGKCSEECEHHHSGSAGEGATHDGEKPAQ